MVKLADIQFDRDVEMIDGHYQNWPAALAKLAHYSRLHSTYIDRLLNSHHQWLIEQLERDVADVVDSLLAIVTGETADPIEKQLRVSKGRIALYLALLDIADTIPVMDTTRYLTLFADFAIEKGTRYLIEKEVARRKLPEKALESECGLFVLAMGKQGAFELNYSSDIDLICFFDETRFEGEDIYGVRKGFIRVIQNLVKLLSEATQDGYVFRTDLRLRPDPSTTPVVITADQAESYYESLGRTWERSAFIKARVCAGDVEAGNAFLKRLRPFIWRKLLDFAAIEDAHNMRLRIRAHKNLDGPINFRGHHLKLGKGGIREIEFFTQTRQLIFGGRNEMLRVRGTIEGLRKLAEYEVIQSELAEYLITEYCWLRKLEHASQMIDDQQTHFVPSSHDAALHFLGLVGEVDFEAFEAKFIERVSEIDAAMESFFEGTRLHEDVGDAPIEAFDDAALEIMENWTGLAAIRSDRAQTLFHSLRPLILKRLAQSASPQDALLSFDRFLKQLPAGVQLFSMFEANPILLDLLTDICALAPSESILLGQNARIFEAVLSPDFFKPIDLSCNEERLVVHLNVELPTDADFEDRLNAVRRFVREEQFRVSIHLLRGLADAQLAGGAYTQIADIALRELHAAVNADMTRRYGPPPGKGAAILAMGKLGSREMTRCSDLDLVVIYDAEGAEMSDGKKPMAVTNYFARFTQNFIQALSVATSEGSLYEVDMRLRPSGRQGPVAVSVKAFEDYQMNDAWTWEHMALLRARVVSGDPELAKSIDSIVKGALTKERDQTKTKADIVEMRSKIRENFNQVKPLSLKHGAGRMMETELLIQGLALLTQSFQGENSSIDILDDLTELNEIDRLQLRDGLALFSHLLQLSRLSFAGEPVDNPPNSWLKWQAIFTDEKDIIKLEKRLLSTSQGLEAIFDKYLM